MNEIKEEDQEPDELDALLQRTDQSDNDVDNNKDHDGELLAN